MNRLNFLSRSFSNRCKLFAACRLFTNKFNFSEFDKTNNGKGVHTDIFKICDHESIRHEWSKVISDVENFTGYSAMYFIERLLFEVETQIVHLDNKYKRNTSSLLSNIRNVARKELVYQLMGLLCMVVQKLQIETYEQDRRIDVHNIYIRQTMLIETCEMLWFMNCMHSELPSKKVQRKYHILLGDYALSKLVYNLSQLRHNQLHSYIFTEMINSVNLEFAEDLFENVTPILCSSIIIDPIPDDCNILEYKQVTRMWRVYNSPKSTLYGICFKGIFMLSNTHGLENHAYILGEHLALALQAYIELQHFILKSKNSKVQYDIETKFSCPALYSQEYFKSQGTKSDANRSTHLAKTEHIIELLNLESKKTEIGILLVEKVIQYHTTIIREQLLHFPDCIARKYLFKIIEILTYKYC